MIGSLITRGLVLMFGYAYPAYECFKSVERNKPDIEQLRFWCQYWILVAMLTVCERIGDLFIGWVPMYGEAKLAFFIYLWFPKTKGTTYVYDSFFKPYVAKHETDIDRNLLELRTRAGDMAIMYWQKAASYGQTRVFEILQYVASQSSTARPAPPSTSTRTAPQVQVQPPQGTRTQKPAAAPTRTSSATAQPEDTQPSSSASTASSSEDPEYTTSEEAGPSELSKAVSAPAAAMKELKAAMALALTARSKSIDSTKEKVDSEPSVTNQNGQPPVVDTLMEEAKPVTRARARKTRGAGTSR